MLGQSNPVAGVILGSYNPILGVTLGQCKTIPGVLLGHSNPIVGLGLGLVRKGKPPGQIVNLIGLKIISNVNIRLLQST